MKVRDFAAICLLALGACGPVAEPELDGRWRVQQIADASLGEGVEIWMEFDTSGEVVRGSTGCNEFSAPLTAYGESLAIGPANEASGECPSVAAATDEQRFLMVLPHVRRHIVHGRSLELLDANAGSEALIRLRREY